MAIACSTSIRCNSSLENALSDIKRMGFHNIDLLAIDGWVHVHTRDLVRQYDRVVTDLDNLLGKYGLKPIALNTGVSAQLHHRSEVINSQRLEEVAALIRLMKHYGITLAAIQPRNTDPSRLWEDVLKDCVATLRDQVGAGRTAGVIFALELHIHSPFETLAQARRLLEAMPEVPLVYDPSHFAMQGIDIKETTWLMKHASHVHLRDAAVGKMQVPYGQGLIDFDWLLSALKERGYLGGFSIEYLEPDQRDFDLSDSVLRLRDKISEYFPE